jgi:ATP-dependent Clp protease ATP-binding subunit ClpC
MNSSPELGPELKKEIAAAGRIMRDAGQRILTPEMLLLAFIRRSGSAAHRTLLQLAQKQNLELKTLEATVESMARARRGRSGGFSFQDPDGGRITLSDKLTEVLDRGIDFAQDDNQTQLNSAHLLAAMASQGVSTAGLLQRHGITVEAISDRFATVPREKVERRYYERSDLLQALTNLLSLTRDRHVILIGAPGTGKRSLVYSLRERMAAGEGPPTLKRLVEVPERALLARPVEALRSSLERARGGILFIPHIHRFFGGPLDAEFKEEARNILRDALLDDRVAIIGSTDRAAYQKLMESNLTVTEHTNSLPVPETNLEETVAILKLHKARLEKDYDISIDEEALETTASLAKRYLPERPLPGGAIELIHHTAASLRAARPKPGERLDSEELTLTLSQMTGIPVSKLGADERTRYARMVEHLHERIIGQEEAVMAVSRAVKTARVGLKDPKRPIGSFLFLGPTGVGKTELAKALAEFMFGDEDAAIELDMSEYQQEHSVNRFIGAPPGYKGHEEGGQLTNAVREKPYSVVLFDEVEKAHSRVLDILLQVMEEGRLTDGQGRTTLFNETVIILTSNMGSEYLIDSTISEVQRELVMDAVKSTLRPEFLNRLDDIILFHPLSSDQLRLILGLMLNKEMRLAAESGITLQVTEAARGWLLAQNKHPEWGARPLRRILRRHLREPLADLLLQEHPEAGADVKVDLDRSVLIFNT